MIINYVHESLGTVPSFASFQGCSKPHLYPSTEQRVMNIKLFLPKLLIVNFFNIKCIFILEVCKFLEKLSKLSEA